MSESSSKLSPSTTLTIQLVSGILIGLIFFLLIVAAGTDLCFGAAALGSSLPEAVMESRSSAIGITVIKSRNIWCHPVFFFNCARGSYYDIVSIIIPHKPHWSPNFGKIHIHHFCVLVNFHNHSKRSLLAGQVFNKIAIDGSFVMSWRRTHLNLNSVNNVRVMIR